MNNKIVLAGLLSEELAEVFNKYPLFRCRQLYHWMLSGAKTFDDMTDLPAPMRKELEEKYRLFPGNTILEKKDTDGTLKMVSSLEDGAVIEGVVLSDAENRKTACLSTQAGCPMGCVFCKTGMMGYRRNLTAAEITGQFLQLLHREPGISNIVIMGMGEPLLNLDALRKAIEFFMHPSGLNISKRRITISTCGIEKGILELADKGPDVRLAFSLTTARQELREQLMPVSRDHPLALVKEALLHFQKKRDQRITLEMVLLSGINTSPVEAGAVSEFARGLNVVINLIPWNHVEGLNLNGKILKTPSSVEISAFAASLKHRGLKATQRYERGHGISAACGQLGSVVCST